MERFKIVILVRKFTSIIQVFLSQSPRKVSTNQNFPIYFGPFAYSKFFWMKNQKNSENS